MEWRCKEHLLDSKGSKTVWTCPLPLRFEGEATVPGRRPALRHIAADIDKRVTVSRDHAPRWFVGPIDDLSLTSRYLSRVNPPHARPARLLRRPAHSHEGHRGDDRGQDSGGTPSSPHRAAPEGWQGKRVLLCRLRQVHHARRHRVRGQHRQSACAALPLRLPHGVERRALRLSTEGYPRPVRFPVDERSA
jgi:hypothetical protein